MSPSPEGSLLAYIKQCKPVLRNSIGKMAYLMHAYISMSDCALISVGDCPDDVLSAPEIDMPQEWSDENFAKLCYRTDSGSILEVAVLKADNNLLLHWSHYLPGTEGTPPVHSTSMEPSQYFTDSNIPGDAYVKAQLKELVDKFGPGIDIALKGEAASQSGVPEGARSVETDAGQQNHGHPRFHDPAQLPTEPAPLQLPPMNPVGTGSMTGGGMHVGPNDPIFTDPLAQPRRPGMGLPPGARYDPIGPPGLPGSHPDDYLSQSREDAWHDIGPPPGGFPGMGPSMGRGRGRRFGPGPGGGFGPGGFGGGPGFL